MRRLPGPERIGRGGDLRVSLFKWNIFHILYLAFSWMSNFLRFSLKDFWKVSVQNCLENIKKNTRKRSIDKNELTL